jgi:hypothetical protein
MWRSISGNSGSAAPSKSEDNSLVLTFESLSLPRILFAESCAATMFDPTSQIRIIVVDPGSDGTSISSSFEFANLSNDIVRNRDLRIEWEAVSYRWDSSGPVQEIQLEGYTRQVANNIFRILNDLRLPSEKRYLWIDAICINQADDHEKSAQVQLMRHVYRQARQVVIWLDCEGLEDAAFAVVNASRWTEQKSRIANTLPNNRHLQQLFMTENPNLPWKAAFHELLRHAWFERIWVVQEAGLAKELLVHLHKDTITWDAFASTAIRFMSLIPASDAIHKDLEACYAICKERNFSGETFRGLSMINLILNLRGWMQFANRPIPASELALLCTGRQATNKSDMVYGIGGFFGFQGDSGNALTVDYSLPADEIFKRFAYWCMKQEGNLDVLAQIRYEFAENTSGLPTWVMEFGKKMGSAYELTTTIPLLLKLSHNPVYAEPPPAIERQGDMLTVRGFIFDELKEQFDMWPEDGVPKSEQLQRWLDLIPDDDVANIMLFGEEKPTISALAELYCRTLEKDQFNSHLWRDGQQASLRVRNPNGGARAKFLTQRGCLAFAFSYFAAEQRLKICYLNGGRGLFVLVPARHSPDGGPQLYNLGCGDCFIDGFEDGNGHLICSALGLQEEDIHIV